MQKKYEAMFLLKPDVSEQERKGLFDYISEVIVKNQGSILSAKIWDERRKLAYAIKKYNEALYYLVEFNVAADTLNRIRDAYKLNEHIIRALILK